MHKDLDEILFLFFRDDVGGILVTRESGEVLLEDEKARQILQKRTNWESACPKAQKDQRGENWELLLRDNGQTFSVISSTFSLDDELVQIHYFHDSSMFTELFRDMSSYTKSLQEEKERDALTGLFNKGKFLEMKRSLFRNQDSIGILNMDLNYLKRTNDLLGHEAGDNLIRKAAESLHRIEARNVMPFRIGGDEFVTVALHLSESGVEELYEKWKDALRELNEQDDSLHCDIACGVAYGTKGYDLEALLALADERMYADKADKKRQD